MLIGSFTSLAATSGFKDALLEFKEFTTSWIFLKRKLIRVKFHLSHGQRLERLIFRMSISSIDQTPTQFSIT